MKITRWTAQIDPNPELINKMLESEGLDLREVEVKSGLKLSNIRTNMREIIQLLEGELIFNLSGTQFVLRTGDRLEIPPNTTYSYSNLKNEKSRFISGKTL